MTRKRGSKANTAEQQGVTHQSMRISDATSVLAQAAVADEQTPVDADTKSPDPAPQVATSPAAGSSVSISWGGNAPITITGGASGSSSSDQSGSAGSPANPLASAQPPSAAQTDSQYLVNSILALQKLDSVLSSLPEGKHLSLTQFLSANYYLSLAVNSWEKLLLNYPNSPIARDLKPIVGISGRDASLYQMTHQDIKQANDGYLYSGKTGKLILQHEPERLTSAHLLNIHSQYEEYKNSVSPVHLTWKNEFCKAGAILLELENILTNHDHHLAPLITPAATHTEAEIDILSAFAEANNAHLLPHLTGAIVTGKYNYSDIDAAFFGKESALMQILHYNTKLYLTLAGSGFSSSIAATYSLQAIGETVRILKSIGSDFIGQIGIEAAQQLILVRNKIAHATGQHSYSPAANLLKFIADQTAHIMPHTPATVSAARDAGVIETKAETTTINITHSSAGLFSGITEQDTIPAPTPSDDQLIAEARKLTLKQLEAIETNHITNATVAEELANKLLEQTQLLLSTADKTQANKAVGKMLHILNEANFDLNCAAKLTLTVTNNSAKKTLKPLTPPEKVSLQFELLEAILKNSQDKSKIITKALKHDIIKSNESGSTVVEILPFNLLIRSILYLEAHKNPASILLSKMGVQQQDYEHNLDQHFLSKMDVMTNPFLLALKLYTALPPYIAQLSCSFIQSFSYMINNHAGGEVPTESPKHIKTLIKGSGNIQLTKGDFSGLAEYQKMALMINMLCDEAQIDNFKVALQNFGDLSMTMNGISLLYLACAHNDKSAITLLLNAGANKELCDNDGWTPLHKACDMGHVEIAKILLDAGANIDAVTYKGSTPLVIVCKVGHTDVAQLLLERGANTEFRTNSGTFALYTACQFNNSKIVKLLLEAGADKEALVRQKFSPLSVASGEGFTETVKVLLDAGVKIDSGAIEAARTTQKTDIIEMLEKHLAHNSSNTNPSQPATVEDAHSGAVAGAVNVADEQDADLPASGGDALPGNDPTASVEVVTMGDLSQGEH